MSKQVTPGSVRELRVTSFDGTTGQMSITYDPACGAADHNIASGPLAEVQLYGYAAQDCAIGNLGSYGAFAPGADSIFFVVVGTVSMARYYGQLKFLNRLINWKIRSVSCDGY